MFALTRLSKVGQCSGKDRAFERGHVKIVFHVDGHRVDDVERGDRFT